MSQEYLYMYIHGRRNLHVWPGDYITVSHANKFQQTEGRVLPLHQNDYNLLFGIYRS